MIKKIVSCVLIAVCFFLTTSCGNPNATGNVESTAKVIRIAVPREDSKISILNLVMKELGYLGKYLSDDVIIEWPTITSHTDKRDALIVGQVDIGNFVLPVLVSAVENDLPILLLCDTMKSDTYLYTSKKYPQSLEDLKQSDKIASVSSLGTNSHLTLMAYALERYGDANYFTNMVGMPVSDVIASMSNTEDLSAAVMSYPFGLEKQASETLELMIDLTPYNREYGLGNYWATSQSFYDNNPEYVEAFNQALRDTVDFINTQPEQAAAIMQKYWTTYSIEEIVKIFEDTPPQLEISESAYNKLANFMYEIDLLENPPKPLSELPNYDSLPLVA